MVAEISSSNNHDHENDDSEKYPEYNLTRSELELVNLRNELDKIEEEINYIGNHEELLLKNLRSGLHRRYKDESKSVNKNKLKHKRKSRLSDKEKDNLTTSIDNKKIDLQVEFRKRFLRDNVCNHVTNSTITTMAIFQPFLLSDPQTIIDLINERDEHAKEAEEISHQMDDTMHEIILTRTDVQDNQEQIQELFAEILNYGNVVERRTIKNMNEKQSSIYKSHLSNIERLNRKREVLRNVVQALIIGLYPRWSDDDRLIETLESLGEPAALSNNNY